MSARPSLAAALTALPVGALSGRGEEPSVLWPGTPVP